jgi:hypothetical protein
VTTKLPPGVTLGDIPPDVVLSDSEWDGEPSQPPDGKDELMRKLVTGKKNDQENRI